MLGLIQSGLLLEYPIYPAYKKKLCLSLGSYSGVAEEDQLMFICRSGGRSRMAAIEMTNQGFKSCYNVSGGFEGNQDDQSHRGMIDGWKFSKLPWKQG